MLPRFETLHRVRPVSLVAPGSAALGEPRLDLTGEPLAEALDDGRLSGDGVPLPAAAPAMAIEVTVELTAEEAVQEAVQTAFVVGGWRLTARCDPSRGDTALELVPPEGEPIRLRSRRHGRVRGRVAHVGLALTGPWLVLLVHDGGAWRVHARADLREHPGAPDVHDPGILAGLRVALDGGPAAALRAGGFGQLGLRDVRLVSDADGTPLREGRRLWLTATHAGPGFADAAHAGVWLLDPETGEAEHTGDLFVRRASPHRPGAPPGVHGDHAVHLVRDGESWLLAASTWDELGPNPRRRPPPRGAVSHVLARTATDPRRGRQVLDGAPLRLPVGDDAVGSWDAHLLRRPAGGGVEPDGWLVAFVVATDWFRFHPALAEGPDLDRLSLRATDPSRVATEGVTLARLPEKGGGEVVRLLASDGPDSPAPMRRRYPVFDLDLRPVGALEAPYPDNIPWPTLAPDGDRWWLVTFDGTPHGGPLAGYGTHGDLIVARSV